MKTPFPYKRIISYGCSFTAGSELTDHEYLGITEEELAACARRNKYIGSHEILQHFSVTVELRAQILESNRTKSWPNYIAKKYYMTFGELVNKNSVNYFFEIVQNPAFQNFTIDALAREVGFSSRQHLNKPFKKFHGGNPSDLLSIHTTE